MSVAHPVSLRRTKEGEEGTYAEDGETTESLRSVRPDRLSRSGRVEESSSRSKINKNQSLSNRTMREGKD